MGNGDSGTVGQMKSEPNGNAKTVPKHKFAACIGKREGSRLHSALKSFEFIVRSAVGPLCGLPQPVAVSAVCCLPQLPAACLSRCPTCISFIFAIYKFIVDCGELRKIANNCGKFQFVQHSPSVCV